MQLIPDGQVIRNWYVLVKNSITAVKAKLKRSHVQEQSVTCEPAFSIGSSTWPGVSKLAEEAGEVVQIVGKLIATGGAANHWDGTNLKTRLADELADLTAAIEFVIDKCDLPVEQIQDRIAAKRAQFEQWHRVVG